MSDRCPLGYLFLTRSFLYVKVTRTCIKISDEFEFRPDRPTDYGGCCPWASKTISHRLIMGKCCVHASSFIFYGIIIIIIGSDYRYSLWSYLPLNDENFYTFELEYLWGKSANLNLILCVASLGLGKGCIRFWGRFDQNSGVHGNRKPPLTYKGGNGVSTYSRLLLIWSFLYLQVTRTCIKTRTSSNLGRSGH